MDFIDTVIKVIVVPWGQIIGFVGGITGLLGGIVSLSLSRKDRRSDLQINSPIFKLDKSLRAAALRPVQGTNEAVVQVFLPLKNVGTRPAHNLDVKFSVFSLQKNYRCEIEAKPKAQRATGVIENGEVVEFSTESKYDQNIQHRIELNLSYEDHFRTKWKMKILKKQKMTLELRKNFSLFMIDEAQFRKLQIAINSLTSSKTPEFLNKIKYGSSDETFATHYKKIEFTQNDYEWLIKFVSSHKELAEISQSLGLMYLLTQIDTKILPEIREKINNE